MKELTNYINEKLKVDDAIPDIKFPVDGSLEDIVEFLKEQGFKDVDKRGTKDLIFNSEKFRCFTYLKGLDGGEILWFADTSKGRISKDNPIFLIKSLSNMHVFVVYYTVSAKMIYKTESDNKETFLEELNKCFGWE